MRSVTAHSSPPFVSDEPQEKPAPLGEYSRPVRFLFYVFALYLVLPIVDFPLLGLSLSAPLFFVIAIICMVNPPQSWFRQNQRWILFALLIWSGVFIATAGNGLLSGGVDINSEGILTVIRYAYWLLVFVVTAHFAAQAGVLQKTVRVLSWGILVLALLRWGEAVFLGKIGAWTGTRLLSQNEYGFLFSTFSPFLMAFLLQAKGWKFLFALLANILLWGAAAVNGSRGSWVAMGIGLLLALLLLFKARPRKFMGLMAGVVFAGGIAAVVLIGAPRLSTAILDRFDTFQSLDTDKSYAIRQLMNKKAILLFEESPLIGVGSARFRLSTIPLEIPSVLGITSQEHYNRKSSHNSYLGFLAEHGLVGTIPFAILLITLAVQTFKVQIRFIKQETYWVMAIFLGFIQMSIHMWVISGLTNTVNWFMYGLVAATIMAGKTKK